jgi:hypothetical protein
MDIIEIVFVPMGRSREMVGFAISGDTNPKIPLKGEGIFIKVIEMGPWFEKEWAWFA